MTVCHESKSKGERGKDEKIMNIHLDDDTSEILEYTKSRNYIFEMACKIED